MQLVEEQLEVISLSLLEYHRISGLFRAGRQVVRLGVLAVASLFLFFVRRQIRITTNRMKSEA